MAVHSGMAVYFIWCGSGKYIKCDVGTNDSIYIVDLKENDICDNSEFSITVHVLKQEIFSVINVTNIIIIYNYYNRIMMYSDI